MSPRTKKILMLAGAALGGYIVYSKFIKKPAGPTMALQTSLMNKSVGTLKSAGITNATMQYSKSAAMAGLLEELGVEESLGSLGSKRR